MTGDVLFAARVRGWASALVFVIGCGSSATKDRSSGAASSDAGASDAGGGVGNGVGGTGGSATTGGAGGGGGSAGGAGGGDLDSGSGADGTSASGIDAGSDGATSAQTDSGSDSDAGSPGDSGADGDSGSVGDCTSPVAMPPIAACGIFGTVRLEYRLVQDDDTLSFDVRLRNGTGGWVTPPTVRVNEIEVHYYFSQEEDSGWQPTIESFVQRGPDVDLGATSEISMGQLDPTLGTLGGFQTHFVRIRNDSSALLLPASSAGDPYLEFRATLSPSSSAPPNQDHTNDYSYEANAASFQDNISMAVFVCGELVVGCTPGQSGVGG